jgi:hypothetical protein
VWKRIVKAVGDILASECVGGLMAGHWLGPLYWLPTIPERGRSSGTFFLFWLLVLVIC